MKKKICLLLLGALAAAALSGCCLSHEWREATCTSPKTCVKCGTTSGSVRQTHQWMEDEASESERCQTCGIIREEAWEETVAGETSAASQPEETGPTAHVETVKISTRERFGEEAVNVVLGRWNSEQVQLGSKGPEIAVSGYMAEFWEDETGLLTQGAEEIPFTWEGIAFDPDQAPQDFRASYLIRLDSGIVTEAVVTGEDRDQMVMHVGEEILTFCKER